MSSDSGNHPFAIQLEVEFLDRLSEPVREGRAKSVSDIIRRALERFNLDNVVVVRPAQLNISVRLPLAVRENLLRASRAKHTSVGQLVRSAVEAFLPQLEAEHSGQLEMSIPQSGRLVEGPASASPAKTAESPRKRNTSRKRKPATRVRTKAKLKKSRAAPPRVKRSTRKRR